MKLHASAAIATFFLLLSSSQIAAAAPIAWLTLSSEPGDLIGQGGTYDITYDATAGDTVVVQIRKTTGFEEPAELLFILDDPTSPANEFALLFSARASLGYQFNRALTPMLNALTSLNRHR